MRHLGAFLGPSWAILGAVLGPFWTILEPSWGLLRHLGAFLGPSWAILGPLPLGSPSTHSENDGCKSKQSNWPPGAHLEFFLSHRGGDRNRGRPGHPSGPGRPGDPAGRAEPPQTPLPWPLWPPWPPWLPWPSLLFSRARSPRWPPSATCTLLRPSELHVYVVS